MTVNLAIDDRVPGHVFRYVERELYDYPVNRELVMDYLRRRNEELTRGRQAPESVNVGSRYEKNEAGELVKTPPQWVVNDAGGFTPGNTSDPVLGKAIRLIALEHRAERAQFYVQAIDSVMGTLNENDKKLVKLRYFEGNLTNAGVACELGISESQYYEWRNAVIRKFAIRFGLA